MRLVLTEDQRELRKTANAFAADRSPLSRVRKLRDVGDRLGYSRDVWRQMADLGWTGVCFAEADGGAGLGLAEMVVLAEALGRTLTPEPLLSSVMLAGQALALAGTERQRAELLRPLIAGKTVLALASQERGARFDLHRVSTRAEGAPSGYRLVGAKIQVMDGAGADGFVVVARTSGAAADADGISLFHVPAGAPGLRVEGQHRLDGRGCALVGLEGVEVPAASLIGELGKGAAVVDAVVDRATVALCGEMLGGMSEAFERTLAYLKERVQFGVPIGSFQALKHRAGRVFVEIELARSAVMAAARAVDERAAHAAAFVSAAKARCSDAYVLAANEAVQMHGGIGMTDEHDIGFFMKRSRVAEMTFGDAAYHRDRFARLCGF